MHLRKGMLVRVIKGNHKGSEGKLLYVFPKKNKAIVEGCLLYTSPSPRD